MREKQWEGYITNWMTVFPGEQNRRGEALFYAGIFVSIKIRGKGKKGGERGEGKGGREGGQAGEKRRDV